MKGYIMKNVTRVVTDSEYRGLSRKAKRGVLNIDSNSAIVKLFTLENIRNDIFSVDYNLDELMVSILFRELYKIVEPVLGMDVEYINKYLVNTKIFNFTQFKKTVVLDSNDLKIEDRSEAIPTTNEEYPKEEKLFFRSTKKNRSFPVGSLLAMMMNLHRLDKNNRKDRQKELRFILKLAKTLGYIIEKEAKVFEKDDKFVIHKTWMLRRDEWLDESKVEWGRMDSPSLRTTKSKFLNRKLIHKEPTFLKDITQQYCNERYLVVKPESYKLKQLDIEAIQNKLTSGGHHAPIEQYIQSWDDAHELAINDIELLDGRRVSFNWSYDFRGRIYCGNSFSFHGEDYYRSVIWFPENQQVNNEWLEIAKANYMGYDKMSWNKRVKEWRKIEIKLEGLTNKQRLNKLVKLGADKPNQLLATINGRNLIDLDHTASGPQVIALMTGDYKLAKACNVIGTERNDLWGHFGKLIKINRGDSKDALMGFIYGLGREALSEEIGVINTSKFISYMETEHTGFSVMLRWCKSIDVNHQVSVDSGSIEPQTEISWRTPDGVKVYMVSHKLKKLTTDIRRNGKSFNVVMDSYVVEPGNFGIGLMANLVHSHDAYVVRRVKAMCLLNGIRLLTTHDSYTCSTVHAEQVRGFVREAMSEITVEHTMAQLDSIAFQLGIRPMVKNFIGKSFKATGEYLIC
jgi:hypothetical protein